MAAIASLLLTFAPLIFKFIDLFFANKAAANDAKKALLDWVSKHINDMQKSVDLHNSALDQIQGFKDEDKQNESTPETPTKNS